MNLWYTIYITNNQEVYNMAGKMIRKSTVIRELKKHIELQQMIRDRPSTEEHFRQMCGWSYDMFRELADDLGILDECDGKVEVLDDETNED